MADEKLVECELLADGMVVDGADAHRGDAIKIPESHYKSLLKHGSVGPKGTI
jgi:hypothetical protein